MSLDGVRASINAYSMNQGNNCIIFAVVASSPPAGSQIENGQLKCPSNSSLDGDCPTPNGPVAFVEINDGQGSGFRCWVYPTVRVALNQNHTFDIHNAGSGSWIAYADGVSFHQLSNVHVSVTVFAWGEATGSAACSGWSAGAAFTSYSRYRAADNSWHFIGSNIAQSSGDGCWSLSPLNSGGQFDAYRN